MTFVSPGFLFLFLPAAAGGFYGLGRRGGRGLAFAWLASMSLVFYGWGDPRQGLLLLVSALFNFILGRVLAERRSRLLLAAGVAANLALLGRYKYSVSLAESLSRLLGRALTPETLVLPLAISFFTVRQVMFLIDVYRGQTREVRALDYCLFTAFFPQLIAGPITRHGEVMSQFVGRKAWSLDPQDASVGLTIFFFGLFKKVVLAEGVAGFIGPVFDLPQGPPGFLESWGAALAYTFQLYFDFSGYSDMAIGAARLFGIRLPANFHSPYKAIGIADFWQRWHMTLTRFLRYYVFLPMVWRSPIGGWWWLSSVMLTFLVSGLWHGVGWNFVVWGLLHGFYLLVEFGWRALRHRFGLDQAAPDAWSRWAGRILTFLAVVVGWVFFRSSTVGGAWRILEGMAGLNGAGVLSSEAPSGLLEAAWLAGLLTVAWFFPNTQQVMAGFRPALNLHKETPGGLESRLRWSPSWAWLAIVLIIAVAASTNLGEATAKFLYARF